MKMASTFTCLLSAKHKTVLFINENLQDNLNLEFLRQILRDQHVNVPAIKTLQLNAALKDKKSCDKFIAQCTNTKDCNVILPPLGDFLIYQKAANIINFIQKLKQLPQVKRIYLRLSVHYLLGQNDDFIRACFEYMADLIITLISPLELVIKKPHSVFHMKRYSLYLANNVYMVEPIKTAKIKSQEQIQPNSTFDMNLEDDEISARTALKLPYEKTTDNMIEAVIFHNSDDDDVDNDLTL